MGIAGDWLFSQLLQDPSTRSNSNVHVSYVIREAVLRHAVYDACRGPTKGARVVSVSEVFSYDSITPVTTQFIIQIGTPRIKMCQINISVP